MSGVTVPAPIAPPQPKAPECCEDCQMAVYSGAGPEYSCQGRCALVAALQDGRLA